jgi:hypothetical protein
MSDSKSRVEIVVGAFLRNGQVVLDRTPMFLALHPEDRKNWGVGFFCGIDLLTDKSQGQLSLEDRRGLEAFPFAGNPASPSASGRS